MVAAAALGTGCDGSSADPAPDAAVPDASVDAAMDAGLDASVCVPGTPFDINGRHAVELTLAMKVSASTVQEQPSTIRIYLLTDLNMLGTTGTATSKLCRVEIPEVRYPSASPMTFDASGAVPSVRSVSSVATVAGSSSCLPRAEHHHTLTSAGLAHIVEEEKSFGGALGRPSGARFKTFERLKRYREGLGDKRDLFITDDYVLRIDRALEEIYRYPLYQSTTDTLNRQLKSGIDDHKPAELALTCAKTADCV